MNFERAREITNSKGVINVTYNNESIWIESINEGRDSARVRNIESHKIFEVPISELKE